MNTLRMISLVFCMALFVWAPMAVAAPAGKQPRATAVLTRPATPPVAPAPAQAPTVRTALVSNPVASVPYLPCPRPALPPSVCFYRSWDYPVGNVAPWSWQHDNQNDDQWPADHGG
jgi:hypothetical protein